MRGLEFVLYADPPAFQLNLNTVPGMEHHEGYDPAAEPRFWFVLDLEIAREHGRPLVGPHPRELVGELPVRDGATRIARVVARVRRAHRRRWRRPGRRAWLETGRWLSKRDAATG